MRQRDVGKAFEMVALYLQESKSSVVFSAPRQGSSFVSKIFIGELWVLSSLLFWK